MAFRYLIYRTDFDNTIVRESPTDTSTGGTESSLFSDFVIPEIQPLYLWRVSGGTEVEPNLDVNINNWLSAIAPPPEPEDDATIGFVTGITTTKIDKVTGATDQVPVFTIDGNLSDSGYAIADLTGGTEYNFTGSGSTQITTGSTSGGTVEIIIYSTPSTGSTVAWGDITGTLSDQTDLQNALDAKLDESLFNSYTGTTETELADKLEASVFTGYTATTQPVIDAALTGVTNLGTGTTLGDTSARNATIKSISVLGGLSLGGDSDNLIISGETNVNVNWGDIGGTLSNQTDLQNALDAKLDESLFNSYTGTTETRLSGIESDITYLSGQTDLRLTISDFNSYTGTTETRLSGIEDDIGELSAVTTVALTGATNGLTPNGRDVELGGTLTKDTVISGTTFDFTLNTADITLQAAGTGGVSIIDTDGTTGVVIESDGGPVELVGNDGGSSEVTKLSISDTQMTITDGRGTPTGIVYAADYSSNFVNESLVSKRYVDSVASGLIPKASVQVATTTNVDLTGGTFASGSTIDGQVVQDGWRVLAKDQTDATENGIWVYSASTSGFTRSEDFDGTPEGEVTDGNLIPVVSGDTQYNTIWVLVTPNPITLGSTELEFTLFSKPHELIGGTGITINGNTISVDGASLAGNSVSWTGDTFNVDISSGTLSTALDSKLNVSDFNSYSGTTDTRLDDIESDISTISGATDSNFNTFTGYTATTETRLETIEDDITGNTAAIATKLDTSIFTGYTATTAPNEIFLIHTGGTELNTVLATAIEWDTANVSGSSFNWTGSSEIQVLETGDYEISYNVPFTSNENNRTMGIGGNIILNNSTVSNDTSSGAVATDSGAVGKLSLATVILSLTADDVLTLAAFRTSDSGSATSAQNGSILIKKKNTLQ